MNLGFINKILDKADKNGMKLGAIYGFIQDPIGDGRGLSGAVPFAIDRLSHWKVPADPIGMFQWAMNYGGNYTALKGGLTAFVTGALLKEVDLHPMLNKFGSILSNIGGGAAVGSALGAIAWLPATTNSPPDPTKFTGEPSPNQMAKWLGYGQLTNQPVIASAHNY